MIKLILLNVLTIPVVALLDYKLLRKNYEQEYGHDPGKWFWLWPCILELMIFNAGIVVGKSDILWWV